MKKEKEETKELERTDVFEKFQAVQDKKKSHIGLIIFLILIIICLVGYICYDKGLLDSFIGKEKTEEPKQEEKLSEDVNGLSEGFIKIDNHNNDEYRIYSVIAYGSNISSYVVGVDNSLYWVRPLEMEQVLSCIEQIPSAKFDASNKFECKIEQDRTGSADYDAEIYKFNGNASDLVKVTSSISYFSTDGSKYPILIYKSGSIESFSQETNDALKDYKIKDFVEEKCEKFDSNMNCESGKLMYKVILQDGSEKTIMK